MTSKTIKKPAPRAMPTAVGQIDMISDDGWLRGWAWYPDASDRLVELEILADGVLVGKVTANEYRDDLKANGVGQGQHAFRFALPDAIVAAAKPVNVAALDKLTGAYLGESVKFFRTVAANAQEQVLELEARLHLLEAKLTDLSNRLHQERTTTGELFATVGQFFVELAEASSHGRRPEPAKSLRSAVDDVQSSLERIELETFTSPILTICINACGGIGRMHSTIRGVQQTSGGGRTEVLLLDNGENIEAALLPLVVDNLRYVRTGKPLNRAGLWNHAARLARGKILVCLEAGFIPEGRWIRDVLSRFGANPGLAAVGAKVIGRDGLVIHIGLKLDGDLIREQGNGQNPGSAFFSHPRHIDAIAQTAFAMRIDIWKAAGGFAETYDDANASLADFCRRIRAEGESIIFEPQFVVRQQGGNG